MKNKGLSPVLTKFLVPERKSERKIFPLTEENRH